MNKKIIDARKLDSLVEVGWMDKCMSRELARLDRDKEEDIRYAIRHYLIPHLENGIYWDRHREEIKLHLSYYLTKGSIPVEIIMKGCEEILAEPPEEKPLNYFHWAWEELFPGEDYHIESLEGFVEDTKSRSS